MEEIRGLDKILLIEPLKILIDMGEVEDIIRKHVSGKDTGVPTNDGWILVDKYGLLVSKITNPESRAEISKKNHPEDAVAIVEKWSAEHPVKTRQSEILKIIPDATIRNGILITKPCEVNEKIKDRCKKYDYCRDCRKEYWLAEVE